jgi:hypothetical protein
VSRGSVILRRAISFVAIAANKSQAASLSQRLLNVPLPYPSQG